MLEREEAEVGEAGEVRKRTGERLVLEDEAVDTAGGTGDAVPGAGGGGGGPAREGGVGVGEGGFEGEERGGVGVGEGEIEGNRDE